MKLKRSTFWRLILAGVVLCVGLVATGLHKKVIRSLHFRFLNAGIVTPRDIEMSEFERLELLPSAASALQLLDEDGQVHLLSDWDSDVIFLNKWATWCAPCIAELPGIQKLYEDVGDRVRFVMVTFDADFDKAKRFKQQKNFTFPIYQVYGFEPDSFKTPSLPATFLFPPQQALMFRYEGMRDYDTPEFKEFLQSLGSP